MKNIAVLGSTGSIGVNTLKVISALKGRFKVVALSADSNISLLSAQARSFRPSSVSVGNESYAAAIKKLLPPGTRVLCGHDGLKEIVSGRGVDIVVFAISGAACLVPLIEAIKSKKAIALANKEALVSAGDLIMAMAARSGVRIIPIDSEHSAVFQCIDGRGWHLSKIYLTGSGGPLLDVDSRRFDSLPVSRILRHPKWAMGRKISVDSATMMNKGLEILEAKYLFGLDESRIEVLVHPEAVVHSMVEFADGAILAQLAVPDMRLPIQYAITYPERLESPVRTVDFGGLPALTFRRPDTRKFPCLGIARAAASSGGTAPAALCAADEVAVGAYLEGTIKFSAIAGVMEKVMSRHKITGPKAITVKGILDADEWAREEARSFCYR